MKFLIITDYLDYAYGGFEPLGVLYILSAIRQAGHEVEMTRCEFNEASRVVDEWKPDFVGYGVYTGYHQVQIELNRRLKEKYDFISVFGGHHPTFFPEMIEEEGVDVVCQGEGEKAIVELMNRAERGEDFTDVKNFWVKRNGRIYKNQVRPLQDDLGQISHPARDIFYRYPEIRSNRIRVVVTARGCPYSCTYCYNYRIKELYHDCGVHHLRHRPVDDVIEEIAAVRDNYPIDFIYFGTDCFTASKTWTLEFAEKYRESLSIPFSCTTRPETTDPEVCRALKSANCITMCMGIESGDEQLRRELLNRKMSNDRIIKAANLIHEAGIQFYTFNMIGFPGETLDQAMKTLQINQQCRTDYTWVSIFQPYPRTKLAEYAMERGYFDGDFDSLSISYYRYSALKNPIRKKLERFQKLISIAVEYPWITPLVKFALNLPLSSLYLLIFKMHKAYCYRYRIMPVRLRFGEVAKLAFRYLFDRS